MSENSEPIGAASPIGDKLSGYHFDAKYAPGTLIKITDAMLWINEPIEKLYAQKNPLKQKWMPAKTQSTT